MDRTDDDLEVLLNYYIHFDSGCWKITVNCYSQNSKIIHKINFYIPYFNSANISDGFRIHYWWSQSEVTADTVLGAREEGLNIRLPGKEGTDARLAEKEEGTNVLPLEKEEGIKAWLLEKEEGIGVLLLRGYNFKGG